MRVQTIEGVDLLHIREFCEITGRSIQSVRHLIEFGNRERKMKFFRDRSRLLIPVTELTGFPFIKSGHASGSREIYHYYKQEDGTYKIGICEVCSYADTPCDSFVEADELVVPKGDD